MDPTIQPDVIREKELSPTEQLFESAERFESEFLFVEAKKAYLELLNYDLSEVERFDVFKNLGNVYLKMMDLNLAEGCYAKAAAIFPKNSILKVNRGVLEIQKGNLEKAKEFFVLALDLDPMNDTAWMGMALVHRSHSDFELSTGCCLRALDLNPKNKSALTHLHKWCSEDSREIPLEPFENFLIENPQDIEIQNILKKLRKAS